MALNTCLPCVKEEKKKKKEDKEEFVYLKIFALQVPHRAPFDFSERSLCKQYLM